MHQLGSYTTRSLSVELNPGTLDTLVNNKYSWQMNSNNISPQNIHLQSLFCFELEFRCSCTSPSVTKRVDGKHTSYHILRNRTELSSEYIFFFRAFFSSFHPLRITYLRIAAARDARLPVPKYGSVVLERVFDLLNIP
ncbi:unnamed protein product [Periconia digitata]|uniref:Uncharacterized protein n=1 Tax=Periconia digitata TaxID=1303443 RepID=A0A9W4XJX2_9PLEO|nr:unnamed protein product [Periconia digitata]